MASFALYTRIMALNIGTYRPGKTPVHLVDPRVKIALMLIYSLALFCINTWAGIAVMVIMLALILVLARISCIQAINHLIPLIVIVLFTILSNAISIGDIKGFSATQNASTEWLDSLGSFHLFGEVFFTYTGLGVGLFLSLRIVLLVLASLVLTSTTSPTDIAYSFEQALQPFEKLGVPSRDIAMAISIALRFIPETIHELYIVKNAQTARGAAFNCGTLFDRVRAWGNVLIPLFIGLFRRADALANAMDSRCYGMGIPSRMKTMRCSKSSWITLILILLVCVVTSFCA